MIFSTIPKYRSEDTPLYFKVVKTKTYLFNPPGATPFYGLSVFFVCSNDINNFPPEDIITNFRLKNEYPHFSSYHTELFEPSSWIKVDRRKLKKGKV